MSVNSKATEAVAICESLFDRMKATVTKGTAEAKSVIEKEVEIAKLKKHTFMRLLTTCGACSVASYLPHLATNERGHINWQKV